MMRYFTPYVKHAKNPFGHTAVIAHNERGKETTYYMPQNIWFAVNLAAGECYDMIPDFIAEIATVNRIPVAKTTPSSRHLEFGNFFYYQMDYNSERAVNKFVIGEDLWKKIDSFEKRVKGIEPTFAINNKMCLAFEKSTAALMAAGLDAKQSVDIAMATKLMPAFITATSGKKTESGDSLSEIFDSVFGDDDMVKCVEVLKNAEAYKKDGYFATEAPKDWDVEDKTENVEKNTDAMSEEPTPEAEVTATVNDGLVSDDYSSNGQD